VLERVIIAGFGGQGVIFLGKLIAQACMHEGRNVTYFPAYGPEVRGGKANCHVVVSSDEIFSPVVAAADTLVVMNQPSWDYFLPRLKPDGLAVVNASLIAPAGQGDGQALVPVPATDVAKQLGDVRAANMVMLGAHNHVRRLVSVDALLAGLRAALGDRKAGLFDLNRQAVHKGIEAAETALAASDQPSP